MKINKKVKISGVLTTKSELSIGGTRNSIGIGASDNPIVKNPLTGQPYIPGSSLKGKMRALMEMAGLAKGNLRKENKKTGEVFYSACSCGKDDCMVCKLFGSLNGKSITRVLFRDMHLTETFENKNVVSVASNTAIDRQTGRALKGSLRDTEHVVEGVEFNYEIEILVMDTDKEEELVKLVEMGMQMVQATNLGAKGSAGFGHIDFNMDKDTYKKETTLFSKVV